MGVGHAEWLDPDLLLTVDMECGAAADQGLDPRARLYELRHHRRTLGQQLLEVVKHEEEVLVA